MRIHVYVGRYVCRNIPPSPNVVSLPDRFSSDTHLARRTPPLTISPFYNALITKSANVLSAKFLSSFETDVTRSLFLQIQMYVLKAIDSNGDKFPHLEASDISTLYSVSM